MDESLSKPLLPRGLWWILGLHFVIIAFFSFLCIFTYKGDFDLTIFNQIFWSLKKTGIPMVTGTAPFERLNWFSWHFSPIYYLLLPVYALFPSPFTLQWLQCFFYSGAGLPMALCFRRLSFNGPQALALTAIFLFNPFYFNAALWDFHEVSIGAFLFAWAFLGLLARHKAGFLLSLFLLLLTKEHYGLAVFGFGLTWAWRHRDPRFGLAVALGGVAALVLVLHVLMPALNHGLAHPMFRDSSMTSRYAWLLQSPGAALAKFHELFLTLGLGGFPGMLYLFYLFLSFVFLPLAAPFYLLPGMADLTANLLSSNFMPRAPSAYHSASLVVALAISLGVTLARSMRKNGRGPAPLTILLVGVMGIVALNVPFPTSQFYLRRLLVPSELVDLQTLRMAQAEAGDDAVCAQPNIGVWFGARAWITPFPEQIAHCNVVVLYLRHPYTGRKVNPFGSLYTLSADGETETLRDMLRHKEWGIVLWRNNWLVLKRGAKSDETEESSVLGHLDHWLDAARLRDN